MAWLQVLHCVMWPRAEYDIPIFGCDAVAQGGKVRFVIADGSPVRTDGALPEDYAHVMAHVRRRTRHILADETPNLPEWTKTVFSDGAYAVRPRNAHGSAFAVATAAAMAKAHMMYAHAAPPAAECYGAAAAPAVLADADKATRRCAALSRAFLCCI